MTVAAYYGKLEFCKLLVNAGANVNFLDVSYCDDSVLMYACESVDFEAVKYLIDSGAKLDHISNDGMNLMMMCLTSSGYYSKRVANL